MKFRKTVAAIIKIQRLDNPGKDQVCPVKFKARHLGIRSNYSPIISGKGKLKNQLVEACISNRSGILKGNSATSYFILIFKKYSDSGH